MEGSINERIKIIVEALNITANAFANELGVAGSVIYNIIKGRNKPSFDILDKMVSSFNVNPNFLLTGKGEVFLTMEERFEKLMDDQTPDEDHIYFLKQWDRINKIVENIGMKRAHDFFSSMGFMLSRSTNIIEHYSLINQSISFLRFAPKPISSDTLTEQVKKMLIFEIELSKILNSHFEILNKVCEEIDRFNEKHDNINYKDDEYFEEILKDMELEFKAKK